LRTGTLSEPVAISPLQRDLLDKMQLEAAMLAAPADESVRTAYFDLLMRFATSRTGLSHAVLPELGHPLYFRCGSTDVANMAQIFRHSSYGFPMRSAPLRILDLGAYVGYAAVYLARRFPQAEILCVEPSVSSFRLLVLNTTPYGRISRMNAAVWHHATRLGVAARYYGDWGTQLQDHVLEADRTIAGLGVPDLLRQAGWTHVDMVKCDIEGAECAVFADPHAAWLHTLDALAVEIHDSIMPGATEIVTACLDRSVFELTRHGENHLFERLEPYRAILRPPPRELSLLHGEPGLFPLLLQNVSDTPWGFFTFDGTSCQLHPNLPGEAPARIVFPRTLDGQTRFRSGIDHAGVLAASVTFSVEIQQENGDIVARAERLVPPGGSLRLNLTFPGLTGRHRIILQTAVDPASVHIHNAWARWIDPLLS
jgi:FkbM family methyltransferase